MNQMIIDDCVAFTGLSRVGIYLWHRDIVAFPDRSFIGGRFLNYVDVLSADASAGLAGGESN
jgi:predicted DNA-binding transcriptional regulator AlpA